MPGDEMTLSDLEARVARLERAIDVAAGPPTAPGGDDSEVFWALRELRRRVPHPAVLYAGAAPSVDSGLVEWQMGHDSQGLLDEDWRPRASGLAALGHPSRLRILQLVVQGEAVTAADLSEAEGLGTTGQIYHHLRQLVAAGWLRSTTKGRHQIPSDRLVPLLVILAASG